MVLVSARASPGTFLDPKMHLQGVRATSASGHFDQRRRKAFPAVLSAKCAELRARPLDLPGLAGLGTCPGRYIRRRARVGARNGPYGLRPSAALLLAAIATVLLPVSAARAIPFAGFSYEPSAPVTGQTVNFTSNATTDPGANIVRQEWDLDDDGQFDDGSGPTATFTYSRPGPVQVALHVVDDLAGEDTHRIRLPVGNRPPVASVFAVPGIPVPGAPVTLYSNSYDPDGFIVSYAWDLDADGNFDDASGSSAAITVPASGAYTVGLRVTDDSGASSTLSFSSNRGGPITSAGAHLMSPFPVVRVSGVVKKKGIKLRLLSINAPLGVKVGVRCRGGGCAFRRRSITVKGPARPTSSAPSATGLVQIRRLGRRLLRVGATVQVYVTSPDSFGKYTRLRIRKSRFPARLDSCTQPGIPTAAPCPNA
jgi:hypothetical protein